MISDVQWEIRAQAEREAIFRYLYQEAGLTVASATDDKLVSILRENPLAGVKAGRTTKQRKLVFPASRSSSSMLRKEQRFISCKFCIHPEK